MKQKMQGPNQQQINAELREGRSAVRKVEWSGKASYRKWLLSWELKAKCKVNLYR